MASGDQAFQVGLLQEQIPLTAVLVEREPRKDFRRNESSLSRQPEALWYPTTDVETEADKQDGQFWGELSKPTPWECLFPTMRSQHKGLSLDTVGREGKWTDSRTSSGKCRWSPRGAPGLATHRMWPTDLTPFRDPLSVAWASYLGGGANQVASFSALPPASCPASSPTAGLDISKAGPRSLVPARGASTTAFQQFPSCPLPGYKVCMSLKP